MARLVAVHFCPANRMAPLMTTSAAWSRSASASTMAAFLPPISSWYLMPRAAACRAMWAPTALEPVKVTAFTAWCWISASPSWDPGPVTTLKTPGGIPASSKTGGDGQRGQGRVGRRL